MTNVFSFTPSNAMFGILAANGDEGEVAAAKDAADWFDAETLAELQADVVGFLPQLATGVVILIVFWIIARVVQSIVRRVGKARGIGVDVVDFLAKSVKITVLVFGVITALGTMGVNVAALVGGLGLTGFALGFALKDVISNMLSGVLLLIYRPFKRNDRIKVSSHEGEVVDIDLRYTELDTEEGRVLIPNANLFSNPVVIFNKEKHTTGPQIE